MNVRKALPFDAKYFSAFFFFFSFFSVYFCPLAFSGKAQHIYCFGSTVKAFLVLNFSIMRILIGLSVALAELYPANKYASGAKVYLSVYLYIYLGTLSSYCQFVWSSSHLLTVDNGKYWKCFSMLSPSRCPVRGMFFCKWDVSQFHFEYEILLCNWNEFKYDETEILIRP